MKKTVIICIPVYKVELNDFEKISLQQVDKILGKYSPMFLAPKTLEFDYGAAYRDWPVERFDDSFFKGTVEYSHLLLSEKFYERFYDYQFLLIYQLDAFVFSDRLLQFCAMDYDFIGAPAARESALYRRMGCLIGNGGFSLRKIDSALRMVQQKERLCKQHPLSRLLHDAEDLFFTYCSTVDSLHFHVPDVKTALRFSVEFDIRHSFKNIRVRVPFGCHGWYLRNYDLWKPLVEEQGYKLPTRGIGDCIDNARRMRERYVIKYLSRRIVRNANASFVQEIMHSMMDICVDYAIWGYGEDGKRCLSLLRLGRISVKVIYDQSASEMGSLIQGVSLRQPDLVEIAKKKNVILVATRKYEQQIAERLMQLGLKKEQDFVLYSEMETRIIRAYYGCGKWGSGL